MSVTRRAIEQEIQKRDEKYEVGKSFLFFLVYRRMCKIMYSSSNPDCVFAWNFLTMEWYLMTRAVFFSILCEPYQLEIFLIIYFSQITTYQWGGGGVITSWNVQSNPKYPVIWTINSIWMYIFYIASILWGIWNCSLVWTIITGTKSWLVIS